MEPKGLEGVFSPSETQKLPETQSENPWKSGGSSAEQRLAEFKSRITDALKPEVGFFSKPAENTNVEIPISNETSRVAAARSNLSQAERYLAHITAEANQRVNGATTEQQQQITSGKTLVEQWKNELKTATEEQDSAELDKSFEGIINQYSAKSLEEFRSIMNNPAIRTTLNIPKYISNEKFTAATERAIARHPGNMRQAA